MNAPAQVGNRPDVIVVGGGVVGCSIAYRLATAGRKVLLLEQRGLASGASGRNGGLTGEGSAMFAGVGDAVFRLTSDNLRILRDLPEEIDADFELRLPGNLDIATTKEQWDHISEAAEGQRAAGIAIELLDADETRKLVPAVSEKILGAKFAPDHGHLWPFGLVHGLANAARRHGAEIRTWTTVQALARRGERVTGVIVNGETIEADEVILATNSYTPLLLPELPKGALVPARGQILVTQMLPPIIAHPFGTNFDKEYGRQVPGGPILCGGFRRLDEDEGLGHYEERVSAPVLSGIARCLTELFPVLRDVNIVRCWAGIMGFTADGLPLVGRMGGADGLTVAAGFNGNGFSWAAAVGLAVRDIVNGGTPAYDMAVFNPNRFDGGSGSWSNPFTAGEGSNARGAVEVA